MKNTNFMLSDIFFMGKKRTGHTSGQLFQVKCAYFTFLQIIVFSIVFYLHTKNYHSELRS